MNFLADLGMTAGEFGLGLVLAGLVLVLAVIALHGRKPNETSTTHMTVLIDSLTRLTSDQAELRGQIKLMTEGQETGRRLVAEQLQNQEREISKALNERLENVTQRVGETLQKTT